MKNNMYDLINILGLKGKNREIFETSLLGFRATTSAFGVKEESIPAERYLRYVRVDVYCRADENDYDEKGTPLGRFEGVLCLTGDYMKDGFNNPADLLKGFDAGFHRGICRCTDNSKVPLNRMNSVFCVTQLEVQKEYWGCQLEALIMENMKEILYKLCGVKPDMVYMCMVAQGNSWVDKINGAQVLFFDDDFPILSI